MKGSRVRWRFTRNAVALLFVLAAMWYAGSSQQNAAAYLLLFGLTSVGVVSIPHAISNIAGLTARAESVKPSFAGQEACLPVEISNQSPASRNGVRLHLVDTPAIYENLDQIGAGKAVRASVRFSTPIRGEHEISAISLETTYPLGLVRVVRNLPINQRYMVYPKPAGDPKLPISGSRTAEDRPQHENSEGDDFAGVRAYTPGESQRHIDWKAVARGQAMMTKLFTAETDIGFLYLDFAAVRSPHVEERLSQLALWIIEAERARRPYGLRLPNTEIAPSLGDNHFHRCLRMLALFK
jgi:uncharacterized protein (DUF58 family)